MKAHTLKATSAEQLGQVLTTTLQQGHLKPTLAFVFSSFEYDLKAIAEVFAQHNIQVCGLTTAGEIQEEAVLENSIVAMLCDISTTAFKLYLSDNQELSLLTNAQKLAKEALATFAKPSILVFSAGTQVIGDEIVQGIKSVSKDITFFGGLAGDNLLIRRTQVFSHEAQIDNGLLALIIDSQKISIKGLSINGWGAVGETKTITKAKNNIVYTIDYQPALEVFTQHFGLGDIHDANTAKAVSVTFPLQLIREDGTAVLRAPLLGNFQDKSLVFVAQVPQGAKVRFSAEPDFDVIEEAVKQIAELKTEAPQVDAVLLISCAARKLAFGPMIEDEVKGIKNVWKAPQIGFFSYGEIGALKSGSCDFHNETISLVTFKEI